MSYDGWTDGALLRRWLDGGEQRPFEEIVRRHGAMVLGVCRRVCGGRAGDVDDAAQLVFATLARRAASLAERASLGGWLNRVAYHTARRLWRSAQVRARHERHAAQARRPAAAITRPPEEGVLLVEEIYFAMESLPDEFREPIVLHHIEGRSVEESARLMGCRVGTVASRLSRGRELLRQRLARRGIALHSAALAAALSDEANAAAAAKLAIDVPRFTSSTLAAGALAATGVTGAFAAGAMPTGGGAPVKAFPWKAFVSWPLTVFSQYRGAALAGAATVSGGAFASVIAISGASAPNPAAKPAAVVPEVRQVWHYVPTPGDARPAPGVDPFPGGGGAVPEPGTMMLLSAVAVACALRPRRVG